MKKKLLHFNNSDSGGGAEVFALDFLSLDAFESVLCVKKKRTNHPNVVSLKRSWLSYLLEFIDKVLFKLLKRKLFANLSVKYAIHGTWKQLQKIPFFREADAIIVHNLHDDFFDLDALEKIAEIKPIYWVLHDMWMMTGGEAYTLDDNGYQTGNAKTPYAYYYPLCHPIIDRRQSYLEKKKQLWQKLAARITFIPVSHWLEGCLKSSYVYHPHLKIQTIPNGVDTTIFFDQHRRNWQKPRFLLFHTDNPFKGTPLAINALKKIDPSLFELYVVGKKIDGLGKQTIFERTNNRNLLNEYYNCVDVLIFPSLAENFPLTTLEAMATGVCVVASRVGGIEEQITEESGFLFERNNEESLFYVLQKLVELPIEVIRTKGMNAKSVVNSKFTKQIMEKSYKRVIEGF